MTATIIWPGVAAQSRHVPKAAVASAPSIFGPRGRAPAIDGHLTEPAEKSAI